MNINKHLFNSFDDNKPVFTADHFKHIKNEFDKFNNGFINTRFLTLPIGFIGGFAYKVTKKGWGLKMVEESVEFLNHRKYDPVMLNDDGNLEFRDHSTVIPDVDELKDLTINTFNSKVKRFDCSKDVSALPDPKSNELIKYVMPDDVSYIYVSFILTSRTKEQPWHFSDKIMEEHVQSIEDNPFFYVYQFRLLDENRNGMAFHGSLHSHAADWPMLCAPVDKVGYACQFMGNNKGLCGELFKLDPQVFKQTFCELNNLHAIWKLPKFPHNEIYDYYTGYRLPKARSFVLFPQTNIPKIGNVFTIPYI